jgi:pimeloyl-ACP methyl ester carboxylesterase
MIYGTSRGAGLALIVLSELTAEEQSRIHGVIAEAPFDSVANNIADRFQLPEIMRTILSWVLPLGPIDYPLPTHVPILIGAGTKDTMCPLAGQKRIAKANPSVTLVVTNAHHDNIWQDPFYRRKVRELYSHK